MITPTLLDFDVITGHTLTGRVFNYKDVGAILLKFDVVETRKLTYNNFIDHHGKTSGTMSDEEHVAFLTLLLSRFVFCSRSM